MFKQLGALKDAFSLFRVGGQIKEAVRAKQLQILVGLLVTAIGLVDGIATAFGHPLHLTQAVIEQLGFGLASLLIGAYAVYNVVLTALSSAKVGLLPAKPADAPGAPDSGQPPGVPGLRAPAPPSPVQQPSSGPERGADPAPPAAPAEQQPNPGYIHLDASCQYIG